MKNGDVAATDSTERVLVMHPIDYNGNVADWIKRLGLPPLAPVWLDFRVPAGSCYAVGVLEFLRNRWQDFSLRVDAPENAE